MAETTPTQLDFSFRPWVRSTCKTAMTWGMGVLALLALGVWWMRGPQSWEWDRGFTVLLAYSTLFWGTLLKIWWTAGKPAVQLDDEAVYFQPLHLFNPKRVEFERVLACTPKVQTQSLRLLVERKGVARELFLNLGVVQGRHRFLDQLGKRLTANGLEPIPNQEDSWSRPGWDQPLVFGQTRTRDESLPPS